MKKQTLIICGLLIALAAAFAVANDEFNPLAPSQNVQVRTYTKHLVADGEGRLMVVDLYDCTAQYVNVKGNEPSRPASVTEPKKWKPRQ